MSRGRTLLRLGFRLQIAGLPRLAGQARVGLPIVAGILPAAVIRIWTRPKQTRVTLETKYYAINYQPITTVRARGET